MKIVAQRYGDHVLGSRRVTTGRTVTEADVVTHAGQTGDFFPHHMDAEWCATQPFGRRMAHGTLVMSLAVGLTASDVNPHSMSYGYERVRFIRPVFLGDTITVEAEIVDKREHPKRAEAGFVDEQVTVRNQRHEVVLVLVHRYLVDK